MYTETKWAKVNCVAVCVPSGMNAIERKRTDPSVRFTRLTFSLAILLSKCGLAAKKAIANETRTEYNEAIHGLQKYKDV